MASTNFVNNVTLTDAGWFNDVNDTVYDLLGNGTNAPSTKSDIITNLGITSVLPSGMVVPFAGSSIPTGWLDCDGSAISRTTYASLFSAIGTTWGTGDGSTTFNLPNLRNSIPIGDGTRSISESGGDAEVDITENELVVPSNKTKWITGMEITFTLTSGTVTGLTSGNTYYVIRVSDTRLSLASSLANAQNGTEIDFSAKSSPVWSISHSDTARVLGEIGGEESHAISSTEMPAHTHTVIDTTSGGGSEAGASRPSGTQQSGSAGGNVAMNNMQPFAVMKYIIKT